MVAISLFICGTLAVITARFTAWYPGERCYPFAIMDSTVTVYYGVPIIAFPIVAITVLYVWIRLIMCKLESRSIAPIDCRYDDDWHKRRVNMLGLIIALLYVSYTLPLFLPYMWFLYFPCTNRWTQAAVLDTSNIFLYLPSCLDPVIYHMGDRNIRNAINKVLLKCRGRNRWQASSSWNVCQLKFNGSWNSLIMSNDTVTPVLKGHCPERPHVLKDQIFLADGPTFQCNWTCHQGPPPGSIWPKRPHFMAKCGWPYKRGSTVYD